MSKLGKAIVITIFSAVLIVTGVLLWVYWPAITGTINGNKYLTPEQGQAMYNKGYDDGFSEKEETTTRLEYYKSLVDGYYNTIKDYERQIGILQTTNDNNAVVINNLESQKSNLESQINSLNLVISRNENTISELTLLKNRLILEVDSLTTSNNDKSSEIGQLNNQISNLEYTIIYLQQTNSSNLTTIEQLNSQVQVLTNQITNMSDIALSNQANVDRLNTRISELENSISYYETYMASLQTSEQVVVTFEFNGSVYNVQIINKNSTVFVANPTSTSAIVFNGWTVSGQSIDLSTYIFTQNTRVVADCLVRYTVNFMIDNTVYYTETVSSGQTLTQVNSPSTSFNGYKQGYVFDGWTIDGINVIPTNTIRTTAVSANTTYYGKFTKLHSISFTSNGSLVHDSATRTRRNGDTLQSSDFNKKPNQYYDYNSNDYAFVGWSVDGTNIVDLSTYRFYADTIFIAKYSPRYLVTFIVDGVTYTSFKVVSNNPVSISPSNPTKEHYEFLGWSVDGTNVIDICSTPITSATTYVAVFRKLPNTVVLNYKGSVISSQSIYDGNYVSIPTGYENDTWYVRSTGFEYSLNTPVTYDMELFVPVDNHKIWNFYDGNTLVKVVRDVYLHDQLAVIDDDTFIAWTLSNGDFISNSEIKFRETDRQAMRYDPWSSCNLYAFKSSNKPIINLYDQNGNVIISNFVYDYELVSLNTCDDFTNYPDINSFIYGVVNEMVGSSNIVGATTSLSTVQQCASENNIFSLLCESRLYCSTSSYRFNVYVKLNNLTELKRKNEMGMYLFNAYNLGYGYDVIENTSRFYDLGENLMFEFNNLAGTVLPYSFEFNVDYGQDQLDVYFGFKYFDYEDNTIKHGCIYCDTYCPWAEFYELTWGSSTQTFDENYDISYFDSILFVDNYFNVTVNSSSYDFSEFSDYIDEYLTNDWFYYDDYLVDGYYDSFPW